MLHLIIDRTVPLRNCTSWTRENAWNLVTGHSAYWSFLHKLISNMFMRLRTARKHHVKDSHDTRDSKTYLAPVGVVGTLITVCIQCQYKSIGIHSQILIYQLKHIIRPSKLKYVSLPVHVLNMKSVPNPYFSESQDFFNSDLMVFKIKVRKCL